MHTYCAKVKGADFNSLKWTIPRAFQCKGSSHIYTLTTSLYPLATRSMRKQVTNLAAKLLPPQTDNFKSKGSWLEIMWGTERLPTIASHHSQLEIANA